MSKAIETLPLIAESLREDPRVLEGKRLIQEAIHTHQLKIQGISPPQEERRVGYQEILDHYAKVRAGKLWYPYIGSGIGSGPLVELLDGSIKYDFICGIGPHYWGHSHPDITDVLLNSALGDTIMQGHLQQNIESYELSKRLVELSGLDHCFLTTTGVMANENALKMIFQKHAPAHRVLAFEKCFMGRTIAISQITDKPKFRDGLPPTLSADYIPFYDATDPEGSTERAVDTLKTHLARYPKEHAAMIFELVQGEGGFYPGSRDFFLTLIKVLKEHGIAILIDEVQTFGRTPSLFAFQHFGLEEHVDLVTIGKLSQVCATLFRSEYKARPGLLSQTFTGSTSMIQASRCIIDSLVDQNYLGANGKIQSMHNYVVSKLEAIREKDPSLVSGPYGIGMMMAFTPYDGSASKVLKLSHNLFEAGVISFVAGINPMRIRFLLPVGALKEHHVDDAFKIIESTLKETKDS